MTEDEVDDNGQKATVPEAGPVSEPSVIDERLEEELKEANSRADSYLQRLQYLQAEFDNYRKRIEREREESNRIGADKLLVSVLNVLDELELAIDVAKKSDDRVVIVAGLEMVLKKLNSVLQKDGLEPVAAEGKDFDPHLHEAVGTVESDDEHAGKVVEEVRKGFTLRGKVIRSSLVKVGVAPERD
jgi:molecular chaperone GrpE